MVSWIISANNTWQGVCCLFVGNHRSGFRKQGAEERNEKILQTTKQHKNRQSVLKCDVDFSKKTSTAMRLVECDFLWIRCLRMPWSLANTTIQERNDPHHVYSEFFSPPTSYTNTAVATFPNEPQPSPNRTAKKRTWRRIKPRCSAFCRNFFPWWSDVSWQGFGKKWWDDVI